MLVSFRAQTRDGQGDTASVEADSSTFESISKAISCDLASVEGMYVGFSHDAAELEEKLIAYRKGHSVADLSLCESNAVGQRSSEEKVLSCGQFLGRDGKFEC